MHEADQLTVIALACGYVAKYRVGQKVAWLFKADSEPYTTGGASVCHFLEGIVGVFKEYTPEKGDGISLMGFGRKGVNFLTDINAMRNALTFLNPVEQIRFASELHQVLQLPDYHDKGQYYFNLWEIITAGPSHLAEAFLRTKGLWKE